MAKLEPKFDFTGETPVALTGGLIKHEAVAIRHNALRPVLFNEYESIMLSLCEAAGDFQQLATDLGCNSNLPDIIKKVRSDYRVSFTTNRLIVDEAADLGAMRLAWKNNKKYIEGDITIDENKLYRCRTGHTSNTSGSFVDDVVNWELIGGGGSTSQDIPLVNHEFVPGNVLCYNSTYQKALANHFETFGLFVVSKVNSSENFTIMQAGYFEVPDGVSLSTVLEDGSAVFTPNTWYYLSDTLAGGLTKVQPMMSQPILYAISTKEAYVVGYRPEQVAIPAVDEFIFISGQPDYNMSYKATGKAGTILSIGGVQQHNGDYSIDGQVLHLTRTDYPANIPMRISYIHSHVYSPGASVREYKFTSTEGQTTFTLQEVPISREHIFVSINGQMLDTDDYYISNYNVILNSPLDINQKVRILDLRAARIVSPDLLNIADNTIPGIKLQQDSVAYDRLEKDVQVLLPYSEGFAAWVKNEIDNDLIPIGSIVARLAGYFGNGDNGTFTDLALPLSPRWKVCDGSLLNDPDSPLFNGANRYLPNITNDRFLMGSTSPGSIGGSNSVTLSPEHVRDHTHTGTAVQGSDAATGGNHQHTLSGTAVQGSDAATGGNHHHVIAETVCVNSPDDYDFTSTGDKDATYSSDTKTTSNGAHSHTLSGTAMLSGAHSHNLSITAGTANESFAILPQYLSCQYIIRIK